MIELVRNLWRYRELCLSLVRREISARYRQSALGIVWALLQPLALMAVFAVVQSFVHLPSEGLPFPIFVYAGLLPWTLFSNSLALMTPSIVSNAGIVKKIYFPREVFPVASAVVSLFDFFMALLALFVLMAIYGVAPTRWLVLLPLLLLIQTLFSLGVGFIASAIGTFQRDVMLAAVFILQLWMYASPVIYPLSAVPAQYRTYYLLNPMAGLITAFRAALVGGAAPDFTLIGISAVEAVVALMVGYRVFKSLELHFADVV